MDALALVVRPINGYNIYKCLSAIDAMLPSMVV